MSFGKGGGTTYQTPQLSEEQKQAIAAQTAMLTGTIIPSYQQAVQGATSLYNLGAPGVTQAAQNLAGVAGQAQRVLGGVGEQAYRTGVTGLEGLFGRDYEAQQLQAALAPAQAQYAQNLAGTRAQFGGMGNLGSARQALAETALAGQTAAAQQQTAAKVMSDIAAQRAGVGSQLAQIGAGGIGQALGAAGQGVSAAMTPQQLFNTYASVLFGTPAASYSPDFRGTQGTTTTGTTFRAGIDYNPFGK